MLSHALRLRTRGNLVRLPIALQATKLVIVRLNSTASSIPNADSTIYNFQQERSKDSDNAEGNNSNNSRRFKNYVNTKNTSFADARKSRIPTVPLLQVLCNDKNLTIDDFFNNLTKTLENDAEFISSKAFITKFGQMSPDLFAQMKALWKSNSNENVPLSLLNKRFLSIVKGFNLMDSIHLHSVCTQLCIESNYAEGLTLWIDSMEYFKQYPEKISGKPTYSGMYPKDKYHFFGLALYLANLYKHNAKHNTSEKVDKEFIKLILQDLKSSIGKLSESFKLLKIPQDISKQCIENYRSYVYSNLDPNDPTSWTPALRAAQEQRSEQVTEVIERLLERSTESNIKLTDDSYSKMMQIYNIDKRFDRSLWAWNEMTVKDQMTPSVKAWNQFLYAHCYANAPKKLLRINSVWKLLQNNDVKPNSESYSILINGYISCKELPEALNVISNLKKSDPALVTSEIRESLLSGMLDANYVRQTDKLFKTYQSESDGDFNPSIRFYNKFLSKLIAENDYERASEIVDFIAASKTVNPDVATYTIIINMLLKKSDRYSLEEDISNVFELMIKNKIKPSENTLTSLIDNFMQKSSTVVIARYLFDYMKRSHMRMSHTLYTVMVTGEARNRNMVEAISLFQEGLNASIRLSPSFYNSIFKGFAYAMDKDATKKFYEDVQTLVKNDESKPNFYTYHYMLRTAESSKDKEFIQWVIGEMGKANLKNYGDSNPKTLRRLCDTYEGVELPENLKAVVDELKN